MVKMCLKVPISKKNKNLPHNNHLFHNLKVQFRYFCALKKPPIGG